MDTFKSFESLLPSVNAQTFDEIALRLFGFQARENLIYRDYLKALRIDPQQVSTLHEIPFLPIRFFKSHVLKTQSWTEADVFMSSGTTGHQTSRHAVFDLAAYCKHAQQIFEAAFGPLTDFHLLALLPSYLERQHSSLVTMIDYFIKVTQSPASGFYNQNIPQLLQDIERLQNGNKKVLVWGVTFALLDVAEKFAPDWGGCWVMETGGMKGRRKEITRETLHGILTNRLQVKNVCSEYGMTELLSQAYTQGGDVFYPGHTLKIIVRDITDPFRKGLQSETGGINVIDLANVRSIAFIETEDLGKVYNNGSFEVLGRADNSDIRGCNLLVE